MAAIFGGEQKEFFGKRALLSNGNVPDLYLNTQTPSLILKSAQVWMEIRGKCGETLSNPPAWLVGRMVVLYQGVIFQDHSLM